MSSHIPYIVQNWNADEPHYDFFYFPQVLNLREVKEIIKIGEELSPTESMVNNGVINKSYRRSTNSWIGNNEKTKWIFDRILAVGLEANDYFRFDLSHFNEPLQFTKYEKGHHYGWHEDTGMGVTKIRKLSVVIQLSDPRSYDGGRLQLFAARGVKLENGIGSAIVFPSYKEHRVTPVTQGSRYSLVSWISGPPFR